MAIIVYSFDFDGCIFNRYYLELSQQGDADALAKANPQLFNHIQKTAKGKSVILMVGSNRQDYGIDYTNTIKKGKYITESCFTALSSISAYLKNILGIDNEFDTYLLADTTNKLIPGSSFLKAEKAIAQRNKEVIKSDDEETAEHPTWMPLSDESKLSVLYAQIHRIASLHPHTEAITYTFYDDRQDILDNLYQVFSQNPNLIPPNVTLQLYQYSGDEVVPYQQEIIGQGELADYYYADTIKSLVAAAEEMDYASRDFNVNLAKFCLGQPEKLVGIKTQIKDRLSIEALKIPLDITVDASEVNTKLDALKLVLETQGNSEKNIVVPKATQNLINDTIGQFVKGGNFNQDKFDQAVKTYEQTVSNLSLQEKVLIAAMAFLGAVVGFVLGVVAGAAISGLNPVAALIAGSGGAILGASLGTAIGGGTGFALSRFGVFKHDPIKDKSSNLLTSIVENSLNMRLAFVENKIL